MRILLIEDEEKVARFVKIGLKAEHYAVDHAKDVPSALSCTLSTAYDLIIVDLTLPKQNGTQFIKKFREINKGLVKMFEMI